MSVKREYKNNIFNTLFNDAEKLLSLYNAVTGSNLPLDTSIKIATLDDVLFISWRNDVAFVLNDRIVVLVEHQSSICANMPLRLLLYLARVYEKIIEKNAIYRSTLLKIPKPDFIVLYNGLDEFPDEITLRLSDAYMKIPETLAGFGGSLELEVRVLNINEGRNEAIVKKSEELYGYVRFIGKAREYLKAGLDSTTALTIASNDCIKEDILSDYLKEHASEVINMLTAEWDINEAQKVWKEEGREEGREEGMEKAVRLMLDDGLPMQRVAKISGWPVDKLQELIPH
jgi:hypothetical protein